MIRFDKLLTAGAAVALAMGTAAIAQTYGGDPNQSGQAPGGSGTGAAMSGGGPSTMNGGPGMGGQGAASAGMAGSNVNATVPQPSTGGAPEVIPQGAHSELVTNGPIPDTPANRAKYGKPMSRTGRHTAPAGN